MGNATITMQRLREARVWTPELIFNVVDAQRSTQIGSGTEYRPTDRIVFQIRQKRTRDAWSDLATPVDVLTVRNSSGYHLFFGRTRQNGIVRRGGLAAGLYQAWAECSGFKPEPFELPLPGNASRIRIELKPAADYAYGAGVALIRGAIRRHDGTGIMGGAVVCSAPETLDAMTDANGEWAISVVVSALPRINGKPQFPQVTFTLPDGSIAAVSSGILTPGLTTRVEQTALSGRIVDVAGEPMTGAQITLTNSQPPVASDASGRWRLFLPITVPSGAGTLRVTKDAQTRLVPISFNAWQNNPIADIAI